ncbi:MAG TPA: hypothetical protein VGF59_29210 [Bryobacteraceae bacterium]|jgi:hypothetical protein
MVGILILILLGALAVIVYMVMKMAGVGQSGHAIAAEDTSQAAGFTSDRVMRLMLAVVLGVIAVYFWTQATVTNGLYFLSVIVFGIGIMALGGLSRLKGLLQSKPAGADEFIPLPLDPADCGIDPETVERAAELVRAGLEIEAVCRQVDPAYAKWDAHRQHEFRAALRAAMRPRRAS